MKRYIFSDLHGQYNLWDKINDYTTEEDELYFLGDACDRGPDGLEIIQELLADPRVNYLKGNHEQFVVDTIAYLLNMNEEDGFHGTSHDLTLHIYNGGRPTIEALTKLSSLELYDLMIKLDHLPTSMTLTNREGKTIFLSHAGKEPTGDMFANFCEYGEPLLWNREHFHYAWPEDEQYKNLVLVHGHTPVNALKLFKDFDPVMEIPEEKHENEIFYYANNHKIDIDLGSFKTHKIALLDLDNLSNIKYFTDEEGILLDERKDS